MMDIFFWAFFGVGFFVMMAMIVFAFLSILEGRRKGERWREIEGESSLLRR